jgi:hypothetical protein
MVIKQNLTVLVLGSLILCSVIFANSFPAYKKGVVNSAHEFSTPHGTVYITNK